MADDSMNVDAAPEPPRQNEERQQNVGQVLQTDTLCPTADWGFKNFLVKIAGEITDDNLETMKYVFSGEGGIGKGVLSKVKTPLELFTLLETRRWLTRDNLLIFQRALLTSNRIDLIRDAAAYAQQTDNTLHLYPASDQPENGFRHVKLHIRGRNFESTSQDDIHLLRMKFANLLFVPVDCIIIDGIEPSTSLILTLQLPELYVQLLVDMLDTDACKSRLKAIGIDMIEFQDIGLIHLSDTEKKSTSVVREEHQKLYNIYQQLENVKKQLEDSEIKRLELQNCLEKEKFEREALLRTMEIKSKPPIENNKQQEALMEFEKHLQRPEFKSYEKDLILSLLDAHSRLVATIMSESHKIMEEKSQNVIKELKTELLPLKLELIIFRAFPSEDSINRMFQENIRKLGENLSVEQEISLGINDEFVQILEKISRSLRPHEREKLEKMYSWAPNEKLKQFMDRDSSFFLVGIFHKEIREKQQLIDPEMFIPQCLETAGRPELIDEFQSLLSAFVKTSSGSARSRSRQNSTSSERKEDAGITIDHDRVKTMADQIDKMHSIIVSAHESVSTSYTSSTKSDSAVF